MDVITCGHLVAELALVALLAVAPVLEEFADGQLLLVIDVEELAKVSLLALATYPVHADHLLLFLLVDWFLMQRLFDLLELFYVEVVKI